MKTRVHPELTSEDKMEPKQRNLAVDDIVLMKDEQAHRNNWPLGRVVHAIKKESPKSDGADLQRWAKKDLRTTNRCISTTGSF